MAGMMFDRSRIGRRSHLAEADFLHTFAAEEIVDRLSLVSRTFKEGLAVGPLTPAIEAAWAAAPVRWTTLTPPFGPMGMVVADEAMPVFRAVGLTVSINHLHLSNDPVAMLTQLRGTLRPDGLFLGAALCSGTLAELTEVMLEADAQTGAGAGLRVAPFADVRRWGDAVSRAGFALPVADALTITVRYKTLLSLFQDLGHMGVRGILASRSPGRRRLFEKASDLYAERHSDPDGRLRATFSFAFLSGWAPDASQQKPAKRGSATVRLEDALKAPLVPKSR
ncbi:MAG: SAM-dependent methyltransferase [Pseudomonadota bacterium]